MPKITQHGGPTNAGHVDVSDPSTVAPEWVAVPEPVEEASEDTVSETEPQEANPRANGGEQGETKPVSSPRRTTTRRSGAK